VNTTIQTAVPTTRERTSSTSNSASARRERPSEGFAALDLAPALVKAVAAAGYTEPTPIQREAIPHVLEGNDLLGCAQTGTGKTAAFALPILDDLLEDVGRGYGIGALVLAPTRELAAQIGASFEQYGGRAGLRTAVIFGGVGKRPQLDALRRGIDILVATPGRLLDLMGDGVVDFSDLRTFVLDEADRMLDMGFIRDVQRITKALPQDRQTLLFSATMPREIRDLANRILVDPVHVAVDPPDSTCEPIAESVYFVERARKVDLLLDLLDGPEVDRVLVFARTKRGANRVAEKLDRASVGAAAIHGNKSQSARERALEGFKNGTTRVVVATDIAARGIDVKGISHVINFDLPDDAESYVHRVGRTGRAGSTGIAISLCSDEERSTLRAIERLTRQQIEVRDVPEHVTARPLPKRDSNERRGGARRGGSQRRGSAGRSNGSSGRRGNASGRSGGRSRRR